MKVQRKLSTLIDVKKIKLKFKIIHKLKNDHKKSIYYHTLSTLSKHILSIKEER